MTLLHFGGYLCNAFFGGYNYNIGSIFYSIKKQNKFLKRKRQDRRQLTVMKSVCFLNSFFCPSEEWIIERATLPLNSIVIDAIPWPMTRATGFRVGFCFLMRNSMKPQASRRDIIFNGIIIKRLHYLIDTISTECQYSISSLDFHVLIIMLRLTLNGNDHVSRGTFGKCYKNLQKMFP